MSKKLILFILFFYFAAILVAAPSSIKKDSLLTFIKLDDQRTREKKLLTYIREFIRNSPSDSLQSGKARIIRLLTKSGMENAKALSYYTEGIYLKYRFPATDAETPMIKAIGSMSNRDDHYLLYVLFINLAFIQTDEGNTIAAISSYGIAEKEAIIINDLNAQLLIDIDIADVFYKSNFSNLSLSYLNRAEEIINEYKLNDDDSKIIIYGSKSQNFFKLNKIDSLEKYNQKLRQIGIKNKEAYTHIKRTDYYISLLRGDFATAIKLIHSARQDSSYQFDILDTQNLADAFFKAGQTDSTVKIINQLLTDTLEANHPEIKYHLYEILGEISQNKNNFKLAAFYFKMALQQSEANVHRLIQAGDIVSQIKIDEIERIYVQKNEIFKKELTWLTFIIIVAILIIIIVTLFYRNIKQKRHYEKLLFAAQKEELAFINSHDIRKHLSNILGIINILEHSDDKEAEYREVEGFLFYSAESLDKAIKSFSEKLDDQF